jgi:hypothetical protein
VAGRRPLPGRCRGPVGRARALSGRSDPVARGTRRSAGRWGASMQAGRSMPPRTTARRSHRWLGRSASHNQRGPSVCERTGNPTRSASSRSWPSPDGTTARGGRSANREEKQCKVEYVSAFNVEHITHADGLNDLHASAQSVIDGSTWNVVTVWGETGATPVPLSPRLNPETPRSRRYGVATRLLTTQRSFTLDSRGRGHDGGIDCGSRAVRRWNQQLDVVVHVGSPTVRSPA